MKYFDIELIDTDVEVENFKFTKVSENHLKKIKNTLKHGDEKYLEFDSQEGSILMHTHFLRGLIYIAHIEKQKTIKEENINNSVEVSKIKLKKQVFSGDKK